MAGTMANWPRAPKSRSRITVDWMGILPMGRLHRQLGIEAAECGGAMRRACLAYIGYDIPLTVVGGDSKHPNQDTLAK